MKLRIVLSLIAIFTFVTGGVTGFYHTFAKETPFQAHLDMHDNDEEKKRRKELRQIVYECKTRYGHDFEKAPDDFTLDYCVNAEIEWELEVEAEGLTKTSNKGG